MPDQLTIDVLSPDTYRFGDPASAGLPLEQYAYLRDEAPVFRQAISDPFLVEEVWVVSRHEDVLAISRDNATYSSARGAVNTFKPNLFNAYEVARGGGMPSMILMDGEEHRCQRRLISPAFTPAAVAAFEARLRPYVRDLVRRMVAMREFDFAQEVATAVTLHAVTELVGVPEEDRPNILRWARALGNPTDPRCAASPEEMVEAAQGLGGYALELLAQHRAAGRDDGVFSTIARAHDAGALTDNELMGFVLLLCAAGSDTTRAVLSHGVYELIRNPEQMAWLRASGADVPRTATDELIRWASPVIHMCRTATRDVELHGQPIAEGDTIALLYPAANRDPRAFAEPDRLDLGRDPNPHLAFGGGAHKCLGQHVAQIEIKVLLEELLRWTRDIRLAGDIDYMREAWMRGVFSLPVEAVPV